MSRNKRLVGMGMLVSNIMTRRVISVMPDELIDAAIELMLKHHISGLPVIDDKGMLVGIVTEGDFLRRPEIGTEHKTGSRWRDAFFSFSKVTDNYVHTHGVKVKDVMTSNPVAVAEDTPLDEVVRLMETRNVKRLPVLRNDKVVGIISRANLMRALVRIHREAQGTANDDARIRDHILDDIARQVWAADVVVDVVVHNGVADLWGTVRQVEQAQALRALIESKPGVKRIEHYLTCHGELLSMT